MFRLSYKTAYSIENQINCYFPVIVCSIEEACMFWLFTGDGFCDDIVNTPECLFDLGDCCLEHKTSKVG